MRRIIYLGLVCLALVVGLAGVAGAQEEAPVPSEPGANPAPIEVGGISVERPAADPQDPSVGGVSVERSSAQLAFTGSSDTSPLLWVGVLLLASGALAIVVTRRRGFSVGAAAVGASGYAPAIAATAGQSPNDFFVFSSPSAAKHGRRWLGGR